MSRRPAEMLRCPAARSRLTAKRRRVAMFSGPRPVRTLEASSRKTVSRMKRSPVFDGPLRANDLRQSLREGFLTGQVRDGTDRLAAASAGPRRLAGAVAVRSASGPEWADPHPAGIKGSAKFCASDTGQVPGTAASSSSHRDGGIECRGGCCHPRRRKLPDPRIEFSFSTTNLTERREHAEGKPNGNVPCCEEIL